MTKKDTGDEDHKTRTNSLTLVCCYFATVTAAKVLLFPAYRSTDFDVHNHWKALTLHLDSTENWYFDNEHVDTVHTLDYPPLFAFFEAFWSNHFITHMLMHRLKWLDETCLELKPSRNDQTGIMMKHSVACVSFMRSTVLVSELVYWLACYVWARMMAANENNNNNSHNTAGGFSWKIFILLSSNPALLWLDHVHFQYNGFLLGILLLSLACLYKGAAYSSQDGSWTFHALHLTAAVLYAMLLTLKHLYMTLALWYFMYLLRKYCFIPSTTTTNKGNSLFAAFSLQRLLLLTSVTATTLAVPFIPFLDAIQLNRIVQRLFPFGRGLVHDYWAGNFWAMYMAAQKVFGRQRLPNNLTPALVACVLLISLLPGAWHAWKAAAVSETEKNRKKETQMPVIVLAQSSILAGLSYSALASFMTAYHVHEKAIVTTLLPLTIWACGTTDSDSDCSRGLLLFRTQALGLAGLLPLLFPSTELAMKLVTLIAYLIYLHHVLFSERRVVTDEFHWKKGNISRAFLTPPQQIAAIVLVVQAVVAMLEVIPLSTFGRFEFLPLAFTSVVVACCLALSYIELLCIVLLGKNNN